MVKTLTCIDGHRWQIADDAFVRSQLRTLTCPQCGAPADTVSDGSNFYETSGDAHQSPPSSNNACRVAGYELLEEAGRGGMGIVYRALDRQHRRIVALKTLQRIDALTLQRFKREFRSLADVAHPNLVSLHELISDGENWCFTMEFIEGDGLLEYIRHGPPQPNALDGSGGDVTVELDPAGLAGSEHIGLTAIQLNRLRSVVGQLASGIAALHGEGILHRDIKPSNVLVTRAGRAVLLDFGLAATLDKSELHHHSHDNILGTVAYMSPEQAAGETVSPATDWYALGSLLYESLTGRTPFTGKPLHVLQAKQREDPPPPSTIWSGVPNDLEQLCLRLLHRDPAVPRGRPDRGRRETAPS